METVLIADKEAFDGKVAAIKAGGLGSLHIVADFDKTLTMTAPKGSGAISTTWEAFDLGPEYLAQRDRLISIYKPIEFDSSFPLGEKIVKMDEWWKLHLELIMKYGLTKELIGDKISGSSFIPRGGLDQLCTFASDKGIPLLVFSAGLGDVIQRFLSDRGILHGNMHVVSNFFSFGPDGRSTGFLGKTIHSYNKSEVALEGEPYMGKIMQRRNVILVGDSLGDAGMAKGISHDTIIKVGFLNGDEKNLEAFKKTFDIVIPGDGGLEPVLRLLEDIK